EERRWPTTTKKPKPTPLQKARPLRRTKALQVKPYPIPRAARQPPPHLQTIAGGKAKNRSPRPTRKTGTRFTRRRTRRRKSDNSCDGTHLLCVRRRLAAFSRSAVGPPICPQASSHAFAV